MFFRSAVVPGLLWMLVSFAPLAALAQFQPGFPPGMGSGQDAGFIEPPRAILQVLDNARQAIEGGRMSDGIVLLGDLLAREAVAEEDADLAGQDFFLDAGDSRGSGRDIKPATDSMLRAAERMLGELPVAGQELYELRYGAKANQLLRAATQTRSRSVLIEISRRYLHTEAGIQATMLLGHLDLSEGRAVGATATFRRLAAAPAARKKFGDSLLILLAEAEWMTGQDEAAVEHLTAIDLSAKQAELAVEAPQPLQTGPSQRRDSAAERWLEQQFGPPGQLSESITPRAEQMQVARGGAANRGAGFGSMPLSRIRWRVETTTSYPQQRKLQEFIDSQGEQVPPPSWQPILVGSQLLMRTTERLMSVDMETGIRVWEYPWSNGAQQVDEDYAEMEAYGNENADELLMQRVWNDLPYGRVTSDGQRVYLLEDLSEIDSMPINQFGQPFVRGGRPADTVSNTLVALDLSTEGKLLWTRGKNGIEPDANGLGDAYFLGPPLPVEGSLYQLAEMAGDIYLICLQPETGEELWRQQILGNDGGRVSSDPKRRIAGAIPAYSQGILVCPTGAGAIVAVDLKSRSLLWGHRFPRSDANMFSRGRGSRYNNALNQADMLDRWMDGTPTICGATVLVTPVEADQIYGFDLFTGKPTWSPILRDEFRYLAGCRNNRFLLVASNRVEAFDVKSGRRAWSAPTTVGGENYFSGTGVFADNSYLLPTAAGTIIEVELETGKVLAERTVDFPLGNLLSNGDTLVSQGATMLSAAYLEQPLRDVVDERLEDTETDLWALVRKGELLLEETRLDEAVNQLLKAREIDPGDEEVRVLLVDAMLSSIRSGKKPDKATTDLLDSLIEMSPQRVELLRLKAMTAMEDRQPLKVVRFLTQLSNIVLIEEQTGRNQQEVAFQLASGVRIQLDTWIGSMLDQATDLASDLDQKNKIESSNPDSFRAQIDSMVAAHIGPRIAQSPTIQMRVITQFGSSPVTDRLRTIIWSSKLDEGTFATAERLAMDALLVADPATSAGKVMKRKWQALLAELYLRADFAEDAAEFAELADIDAGTLAVIGEQTQAHVWPAGVEVRARDDFSRGTLDRRRFSLVDVVSRRGKTMAGWQPKLNGTSSGELLLKDPRGMDYQLDIGTARNGNEMVQAAFDRGIMLLLTSDEIVAIDLLVLRTMPVDSVLWRRKWFNQSGNSSVRSRNDSSFFHDSRKNYLYTSQKDGQTISGAMRLGPIVGRRFFLLQGRDVIAIDVITNEELWRSSGHSEDSHVVANEDYVAVVSDDKGIKLLNYSNGQLFKEEVWEPSEKIVMSAGTHLLTVRNNAIPETTNGSSAEVERSIRLVDPTTNDTKMSVTFTDAAVEPTTYARIIDGRYLALLTGGKRLLIWDLLIGKELSDEEVEITGSISGFYTFRNRGNLILALTRRGQRDIDRQSGNIINMTDGPEHVDVDGPLIAISLEDGTIQWRYEMQDAWGISLDQAVDSPLILMTRTQTSFEDTGRGARKLDLIAIDSRIGELAIQIDQMEVQSNFTSIGTELRVLPMQNMVDVSINRYGFSFSFVDEVLAPASRIIDAATIKSQQEEYRESSRNGRFDGIEVEVEIP